MAKLDDVSWHLSGDDFPPDTPEENAATHIGMFATWAINNGYWGQFPGVDWSKPVEMVRNRTISGRTFILEHCDGKLFSEMLNERGRSFADSYYRQTYLKDFHNLLSTGLASDYLVEDTSSNYERVAAKISERDMNFAGKPWWRFW